MPYAESFILTTDFATLKNDAASSAIVLLPASQAITGNGFIEFHSDIIIGVQGSITRVQIASSKNGNQIQSTRYTSGTLNGITLGSPAAYDRIAFVYRVNPTTVRCQVYIPNPYSTALTTSTGAETFTFYINTFIPPYA